jgi:hypothetical protein
LYLCTTAFLPLGLPTADRFWSGAAAAWSSVKIWGGADFKVDRALVGRQKGD